MNLPAPGENAMKTGQVCSRDVITVRLSTPLTEAAVRMREHHVGSLVVVEPQTRKPLGMITDRDIVIAVVAAGMDPRIVSVGEVMAGTLHTVNEEEGALEALGKLRRHGVRRLPVVDAKGALAGIVSLDDLLALVADALAQGVAAIQSGRSVEAWRTHREMA
jgi:CBS domain-containing protein